MGYVSILVLMGGTFLGWRRVRASTLWQSVLSAAELATLIAAILLAGLLTGVLFTMAVFAGGLTAYSIYLAVQHQYRMAQAAARNADRKATTADMQALARRLAKDKAILSIGIETRDELIIALSERGRTIEEIEAMAPWCARLMVIFDQKPDVLVAKLDTLIRRVGKVAEETQEVADVLTATAKMSAMTFEESLDALLAVYGGTST